MPTRHLARLFLVAATVLVFRGALGADLIWDDRTLVTQAAGDPGPGTRWWQAPFLPDPDGEGAAYWRPVVNAFFRLQATLWGESPTGFHLASLLVHLLTVLLVYEWLLRRLRGAPAAASGAALVGALLFAVHPTRVSSVVWIAGATDLLMTFFVVLGLVLWQRRAAWTTCIAAIAFGAAVLCKEVAILVPIFLLAEQLFGEDEQRGGWLSLGLAAVVVAAVTAWRFAVVPAASALADGGGLLLAGQRVLSAVGHYAVRILWPVPPSLQLAYRRSDPSGAEVFEPWSVVLGATTLLLTLAFVVWAARRTARRPWLADLVWLVGPLLPVLHLLPTSWKWLVADRYLHLPLLGLSALIARALVGIQERVALPRGSLWIGATLLAGLAFAVTDPALGHWRSEALFWAEEHRRHPESAVSVQQHSRILIREQRFAEAEAVLRAALKDGGFRSDPGARAELALLAAGARLSTTSGAEADTLKSLDAFFEQFATPAGPQAAARSLGLPADLPAGARTGWRDDAEKLVVPAAVAASRAGRFDRAETLLAALCSREPGRAVAWAERALNAGRALDLSRAAHILARTPLDQRSAAPVLRARQRLARAAAAAPPPNAPEPERTMRRAIALLELGAPEHARSELERLSEKERWSRRVVQIAVRLELLDRRPEAARELLHEASRRAPQHEAYWREGLRRLQQASPR